MQHVGLNLPGQHPSLTRETYGTCWRQERESRARKHHGGPRSMLDASDGCQPQRLDLGDTWNICDASAPQDGGDHQHAEPENEQNLHGQLWRPKQEGHAFLVTSGLGSTLGKQARLVSAGGTWASIGGQVREWCGLRFSGAQGEPSIHIGLRCKVCVPLQAVARPCGARDWTLHDAR